MMIWFGKIDCTDRILPYCCCGFYCDCYFVIVAICVHGAMAWEQMYTRFGFLGEWSTSRASTCISGAMMAIIQSGACPRLCAMGDFRNVRLLIFVCDEGSEGWSMFQFLANCVKARTIFIRDPLHRMSNMFTNALSVVSGIEFERFVNCECWWMVWIVKGEL